MIFSPDYVTELYQTMMSTPRADLKYIEDELNNKVPDSLQSAFIEKESKEGAKEKYRSRKEKETVICPPTCLGTL